MKLKFTTQTETEFTFQGQTHSSLNNNTVFAIDTEKIVAWNFVEGQLHLWFQGISESVCLHEASSQLGCSKDNFNALLLCLHSEFEDFQTFTESAFSKSPTDQ